MPIIRSGNVSPGPGIPDTVAISAAMSACAN
jgi:hypothetical protein